MAYSDNSHEKLFQNHIDRMSKPTVDKNLQMQIPGLDISDQTIEKPLYSPIYSHYANSQSDKFSTSLPLNEAEISQAISDAERSYQAWKKMKGSIELKLDIKHR